MLVLDRVYIDYQWLNNLDSSSVLFGTRLKSNADIEVVEPFLTNEKHEHTLSDQDIILKGFYTQKKYPKKLRVVKIYDVEYDQ